VLDGGTPIAHEILKNVILWIGISKHANVVLQRCDLLQRSCRVLEFLVQVLFGRRFQTKKSVATEFIRATAPRQ